MSTSNINSIDYLITKSGTVPRLTHSNYPAWTNAIKYVLIGTDTWNIVTGDEEEPDGDNYEFRKRTNKAVSLLYGSVTLSFNPTLLALLIRK